MSEKSEVHKALSSLIFFDPSRDCKLDLKVSKKNHKIPEYFSFDLNNIRRIRHFIGITTSGRIVLPRNPCIVRFIIYIRGFLPVLFVDCKTCWTWRLKLQANISDVICLTFVNRFMFLVNKKKSNRAVLSLIKKVTIHLEGNPKYFTRHQLILILLLLLYLVDPFQIKKSDSANVFIASVFHVNQFKSSNPKCMFNLPRFTVKLTSCVWTSSNMVTDCHHVWL